MRAESWAGLGLRIKVSYSGGGAFFRSMSDRSEGKQVVKRQVLSLLPPTCAPPWLADPAQD